MMLFRRDIAPSCAYCKFGISLGFGEIACSKKGIMTEEGKCTSFYYEPTKRKPEYVNIPVAQKIDAGDFSL